VKFAHVADVKQTRGLSDGLMLFQYAAILHRHVPAAEVDEAGPMFGMKLAKGDLLYFRHLIVGLIY
jgi:hypothetical protein